MVFFDVKELFFINVFILILEFTVLMYEPYFHNYYTAIYTCHDIVCVYIPVSLQEGGTVFALGLGIPLTFLLTAIISSLLTSLITYLCLVRSRSHKHTPPVQEPASIRSTSRARSDIELKPNLAYGQITSIRSDEPSYETILP